MGLQAEELTADEQRAVARGVRAAKDREAELRAGGVTGGRAGKQAVAEGAPKPKKKADKKRGR